MRERERAKYRKAWEMDDYRYHSPAERRLKSIRAQIDKVGASSVVDLGTGTGRAALALAKDGHEVTLVDIATNCLDEDVAEVAPAVIETCLWDTDMPNEVGRHDFALCVDVLEHIPSEKVDAVLDNIFAVSEHGYLAIATFPDAMGKKIGEPLHLTVESADWWRKKIGDRAKVRSEGSYAVARY